MANASICDRFIEVMAMLRSIDPGNDEPMRHAIRSQRRIAEQLIDDAIRQAFELAWLAKDIPVQGKAMVEEAIAAIPQHSKE
jgi:hypothetical protein